MNSLAAQIIADILSKRLQMPADSVWLRNQNRLIPNDTGLYIVVGLVEARPMANVTYFKNNGLAANWDQGQIFDQSGKLWDQPVTVEINEVQMHERIMVDILSRSNDALLRNWEIVAALQSFYSQQAQESNNFKIFRITDSFVETSAAEGGSMLNRYSITIPCFVWYRKETPILPPGDYYNDFTTSLNTDFVQPALHWDDNITFDSNDQYWDEAEAVMKQIAKFEINSGGIVP